MKKKTLLLTSLLTVSFLCGCKTKKPTQPSTSSSSPTTSQTTSPTTSSSNNNKDKIEHRNPFNTEISTDAVLREYKAAFDSMVDDFTASTLPSGTTAVQKKSTLKVLVDSEAANFPNTPDAAIYKMATGSTNIQDYDSINFRMRVVEGKIGYENLVLSLRGDDSFDLFNIELKDALDDDGEALPKLGGDFVDVCISLNASLEDPDVKYTKSNGAESSEVKVLEKILGFHLVAKGDVSAVVEIENISVSKGEENKILDDFNRKDVNKADETCYWRGSTGFVQMSGIELGKDKKYVSSPVTLGENTELVLNVMGDTTTTKIAAVTAEGAKTPVAWSALKDKNGKAVANAVDGAFYPLAINLEQSGLKEEGLVGFEITSEKTLRINQVFLSQLKEKEAAKEYPHIDTNNAVFFDRFNRTQNQIETSYDDSVNNETIKTSDVYCSIAYSGQDKVKVDGDALVFSPQENYTQVAEDTKAPRKNQKYLVLSMKLEGEGTLDNFRIAAGQGQAVYANDWYAGEGLKSIPQDKDDYKYVTEDGYTLYIIDLEATKDLSNLTNNLSLYYTGTATLFIDSIFYTNDYEVLASKEQAVNKEIDLVGYNYVGGIDVDNTARYLKIKASGDENTTFASLRFEFDSTIFFAKDNPWITKDGDEITNETRISEEETEFVIDLVASGIIKEDSPKATLHLHSGGEGATGNLNVISMTLYSKVDYQKTNSTYKGTTANTKTAYSYFGGDTLSSDAKYLTLHLTSEDGATLESLRLANDDGEKWFKDGKLIDQNGKVIDAKTVIGENGLDVTIDLQASGITSEGGVLHIHAGAFSEVEEKSLTLESAKVSYKNVPYSVIMDAYNETPTIAE